MIEKLIEAVVVGSPGAVGVVAVVILFLRHLERSETARSETLIHLGDECHNVQQRAIESLDRNTEMLGRTAECLKQVEDKLDRWPKSS